LHKTKIESQIAGMIATDDSFTTRTELSNWIMTRAVWYLRNQSWQWLVGARRSHCKEEVRFRPPPHSNCWWGLGTYPAFRI